MTKHGNTAPMENMSRHATSSFTLAKTNPLAKPSTIPTLVATDCAKD